MYKKMLLIGIALIMFFVYSYAAEEAQQVAPAAVQEVQTPAAVQEAQTPPPIAKRPGMPKENVVAIATTAVKTRGIDLEEVNIIYDEDNKLWSEKIGYMTTQDTDPNHGVLKRGFLRNYQTVYFDFKEPLKDIWVFIDKDTGDVSEVYTEQ